MHFKLKNQQDKQKIISYLEKLPDKVSDTIWIQTGKRKVGIPEYKFLSLLGYTKDDEKLCPVCGKSFLYNTLCLRNKKRIHFETI
jgi:hypothetical protein